VWGSESTKPCYDFCALFQSRALRCRFSSVCPHVLDRRSQQGVRKDDPISKHWTECPDHAGGIRPALGRDACLRCHAGGLGGTQHILTRDSAVGIAFSGKRKRHHCVQPDTSHTQLSRHGCESTTAARTKVRRQKWVANHVAFLIQDPSVTERY